MDSIKDTHKLCQVCSNIYKKRQNCSKKEWELSKFCSKECQTKGRVYVHPRYSFPTGNTPWNKGLFGVCCNTGRTHIKKGQHLSTKTEFFKGQVSLNKGKPNPRFQGANNPRWKGGITPENFKIRWSQEYKDFRLRILKRDHYACNVCGRHRKVGDRVILEVHHIKSFADYPELRFEDKNAITLCKECHKKTDNYGVNKK